MQTTRSLKIITAIAACFALGSFALLAFVWFQKPGQQDTLRTLPTLSAQQKADAMNSLSASNQVTATGTVQTTPQVQTKPSSVPTNAADPNDPNAAAKLKALESLNSQ